MRKHPAPNIYKTNMKNRNVEKKKQDGKILKRSLDFSCLDALYKHKMNLKKKKECNENEEMFKTKNKKEMKQKEKRREKEKLRETPENIANSSLFRYINEFMYKNKSDIVQKKLNDSKSMFHIYHMGYRNQINKWPNNPNDIIIKFLKSNFTENDKIADLGCGEAQIAQSLQKWDIDSFDLIKYNEYVTVCNITKLDISDNFYDCVVLSLSLMNIDWPKIIFEASRCLKKNGVLVIAEVTSRFVKYKSFFKFMKNTHFKMLKKVNLDNFFFLFFFENNKKEEKAQPINEQNILRISQTLAPCIYRKR